MTGNMFGKFLSSPSTPPICLISLSVTLGKTCRLDSQMPGVWGAQPSGVGNDSVSIWDCLVHSSQSVTQTEQVMTKPECLCLHGAKWRNEERTRPEQAEATLLFVTPVRVILSLWDFTPGSINSGVSLRKQSAFQRVAVSNCVNTQKGLLIQKLLTPLGRHSHYVSASAFALVTHKVCVEPCPYVRGTNNSQKTKEHK